MNQKNIKLTHSGMNLSQLAFRILFAIFWVHNTLLNFAVYIIKRLPIIGGFGDYIIPAFTVLALLLALTHMVQYIYSKDLLFYIVITSVILCTMLILPKNGEYIQADLWRILGLAVPAYYLGLCYDHDMLKKDLFWWSALTTVLMFAYQMYMLARGRELENDNMNTAYNVLPSVLYLCYWVFESKKLRHWVLVVLGAILLLALGTRGPILVFVVFLTLLVYLNCVWKRKGFWRVLSTLLLLLMIILVFSTDILMEFSVLMSKRFGQMGFSTRIFDMFIEENITYDSGRSLLADQVSEAIKENLFLGYGFMGDRSIIGSYAHNLVLEVWCHYGVFIGSAVLLGLIISPISAIYRCHRRDLKCIVLMFACMVFIKLMLSGSYVYETYLFLLLGICQGVKRRDLQTNSQPVAN